ncbi:MAG: glycosyltransferase family 39 protein [Isosphaeraceae bacterium]|nr:glycosyltransferase family 39 protein [Isosphaeraceae bacterium]
MKTLPAPTQPWVLTRTQAIPGKDLPTTAPRWRRRETVVLSAALALAFALRLTFTRFRTILVDWDSAPYLVLARNLSAGIGFREHSGGPPHTWFQPLYPVLISLASRLVPNFECAALIVSALFGSLVLIPLFLLARRIYSGRVAFLAAALFVFNYRLVEASSQIITEMPYTMFWLFGLYFALRIFETPVPRYSDHLAFGGCLGLAALTRTEGTLYLGLLGSLLLIRALMLMRRDIRTGGRAIVSLALAVATFGLTISPYLNFLHESLGHFTITGRSVRTVFAVIDAPTETYEFHEEGTFEYVRKYPLACLHRILHNVEYIVRRHGNWAFPPLSVALIAVSFFGRPWGPRRSARELFLLTVFLFPWLTFYGITGLLNRYYLAFVALGILWSANGVDTVAQWFARSRFLSSVRPRWNARRYGAAAAAVVAVAFLTNLQQLSLPIRLGHFPIHADERKDLALGNWIKDDSRGQQPRVMCASPRIAYYAGGDYFGDNSTRLNRSNLNEYLRANRIDYVVADAFFTKQWYPNLRFLADEHECPVYLDFATKFRYTYDNGEEGFVNLYKTRVGAPALSP